MKRDAQAKKDPQPDPSTSHRVISRREFLQVMGAAAAGLMAAGCNPESLTETLAPAVGPTPSALAFTPAVAPAPALTPRLPAVSQVAIGRAASYERSLVRQQVQSMLDGVGGLEDVIGLGDRVAVKVNLTSGMHFMPPADVPATESYVTHPEVVRALGELLRDAGAGELFIVEAVYDDQSYPLWGYEEVARGLGAQLIDLNTSDPYPDFGSATVGENWFIYEDFVFNRVLQEVDAFVSVAKMKCHWNCGVTLSMKNLIGLVPVTNYRLTEDHWWRSAFHGYSIDAAKTRLPGVIMDLNRARPIHLAVIDGIKTGEGGEVPRGSFAIVEPGVLVAGKDPLATDAVATAVMGFDPTIEPPAPPFIRSWNYLSLAHELGLGTNRLEEIGVIGTSIDEVRFPFEPSWQQ